MYQQGITVESALDLANEASEKEMGGIYPRSLICLAEYIKEIESDEYDKKYRAVVAVDSIKNFFDHMLACGFFGEMATLEYEKYMNKLLNEIHIDD